LAEKDKKLNVNIGREREMSVEGKWNLKIQTPMGEQTPTLTLVAKGNALSGTFAGARGTANFDGGTIDGNNIAFTVKIEAMGQTFSLECQAAIDGDKISGEIKSPMGPTRFSGVRA
jgi:hypothetical protein